MPFSSENSKYNGKLSPTKPTHEPEPQEVSAQNHQLGANWGYSPMGVNPNRQASFFLSPSHFHTPSDTTTTSQHGLGLGSGTYDLSTSSSRIEEVHELAPAPPEWTGVGTEDENLKVMFQKRNV
ncbi:hypothetical protein CROQUDRAFT_91745 [Cronartium quercuum f. sp. fusiforme G11]|uniref:Uncharacterized protein n=1 Tax=Cronartium quercuum f. sp. fusiforme G11 TaxID=708437 RepID=A0A9P6NP88_9BASI|nr:hypothetical protein CROQUDRAFT_91745 [Cronartium quercuum f. sp. fusiforme G11]